MELGVIKLSSSSALNLQDFSSSVGRKLINKPSLPKPFLQLNGRPQTFLNQLNSDRFPPRTSKRSILAQSGSQGWDLGRFLKTLFFFNEPPSPAKIIESLVSKLSNPSPSEPVKRMETSGTVLVAGATGGVGRRVVNILRKKGMPVRVLVRNEEKARQMLGPDIDLIVGDITKESTLIPEYFKGVRRVINAVSVIVGPKEGDTPDRQKYSQGIKFFEPEIKGDSPEKVEYIGMKNLINALKQSVGLQNGKLLFGYEGRLISGTLERASRAREKRQETRRRAFSPGRTPMAPLSMRSGPGGEAVVKLWRGSKATVWLWVGGWVVVPVLADRFRSAFSVCG